MIARISDKGPARLVRAPLRHRFQLIMSSRELPVFVRRGPNGPEVDAQQIRLVCDPIAFLETYAVVLFLKEQTELSRSENDARKRRLLNETHQSAAVRRARVKHRFVVPNDAS